MLLYDGCSVGTRRNYGLTELIKNRKARKALRKLSSDLDSNEGARIAVKTAISVLAVTNPHIGMAVTAYEAAKLAMDAKDVADTFERRYKRTGSFQKAMISASKPARKIIEKEAKSRAVDSVVDSIGPSSAGGVRMNKGTDILLRCTAKVVVKEAIGA